MISRTRRQKRVLRRSLKRHLRRAKGEERQLIELALSDGDIFEMVYDEAVSQAVSAEVVTVSARAADGSPFIDNLLKLFDWFIQNGPALIEIIRVIGGLFGGVSAAVEAYREEIMVE